jgi:hypothetical protein
MGVPFTGNTDQILETASVLQGQLDIPDEFLRHIERIALPTATAVKHITSMAFSGGAGRAVGPHAGTLTQG